MSSANFHFSTQEWLNLYLGWCQRSRSVSKYSCYQHLLCHILILQIHVFFIAMSVCTTVVNVFSNTLTVPASVAQLDAPSNWRPGSRGFNPRRGRQHSFVEIDHEIFSIVIRSLPLIQEGQLSVSGERMCTILVNRLED